MWIQKEIKLRSRNRGISIITDEIYNQLPELKNINTGLANIFLKHTSASLTINENVSGDVRSDLENYLNRVIPENNSYYDHTMEGPDDMPSHIKSSVLGCSLIIPITNGKFNFGAWQGIYLCEYRNNGGPRKIVVTLQGE